jgi:hypothetical protein
MNKAVLSAIRNAIEKTEIERRAVISLFDPDLATGAPTGASCFGSRRYRHLVM